MAQAQIEANKRFRKKSYDRIEITVPKGDREKIVQAASAAGMSVNAFIKEALVEYIARKVADEGITVIIANGKRDNILVDLLQQPDDTVCTRFIPSTEAVSSVKKWIAHSEGFAKGEIHINECATDILSSETAASILPVGITHIEGEFEKDDIVRIMDFQGNQVGVGKANCDSAQAREAMGKHGKKPVVHYDYLYIE